MQKRIEVCVSVGVRGVGAWGALLQPGPKLGLLGGAREERVGGEVSDV